MRCREVKAFYVKLLTDIGVANPEQYVAKIRAEAVKTSGMVHLAANDGESVYIPSSYFDRRITAKLKTTLVHEFGALMGLKDTTNQKLEGLYREQGKDVVVDLDSDLAKAIRSEIGTESTDRHALSDIFPGDEIAVELLNRGEFLALFGVSTPEAWEAAYGSNAGAVDFVRQVAANVVVALFGGDVDVICPAGGRGFAAALNAQPTTGPERSLEFTV